MKKRVLVVFGTRPEAIKNGSGSARTEAQLRL